MKKLKLPTQKLLQEYFSYDEITGKLYWTTPTSTKVKSGDEAGTINGRQGYLRVKLLGKNYLVHRIIYKLVYNRTPNIVDHKNHITTDNRLSNLRSVTISGNQHNQITPHKDNSTGYLGVTKKFNKFMAQVMVDGKYKYLGYYKTAEEASVVYNKMKEIM